MCSTERQDAADLVLTDDDEIIQQDNCHAKTEEDKTEDVISNKHQKIKAEKSELSRLCDERFSPDSSKKLPSPTETSEPQQSPGSDSDDTPEPALPLTSNIWPTECVIHECADADEDEQEDSFLAVFANPHFVAADRGEFEECPPNQDEAPNQPRSTLKGMTIRVHAPRQRLPESDYEVQWQADPSEFPGLVRVQASVVRERFEAQYACSETGRPIEVHQEGERIEVARVTCYRLRPRALQQHHNTTWQEKYPSVARFLEAMVDGPKVDSYYRPRRTVQSVSQLLLEDLYVHPEYRGGGLGLSLLDHASRKVGEVLASVVLGLPQGFQAPDDEDDNKLEHYFGLLGYRSIHPHYLARSVGYIMLEESCPTAPILDPSRREAY